MSNPNDNPVPRETRQLNAAREVVQAMRALERAQKKLFAAFADEKVNAVERELTAAMHEPTREASLSECSDAALRHEVIRRGLI
ncbi:MAG TPA: hypothetical protein VNU68_32140 [Verrucomicrobiae bacterium]|nr:hypothetical protein [Verrucomicrobiae bacterium]